jgi:predicted Zn-dependent protease
MSREARPEGFGDGSRGCLVSIIAMLVGVALIVGAIWLGVTRGSEHLLPHIPRAWDAKLGEYAIKTMVDENGPCAGSEMERWVKTVGPKLVLETDDEPFEFKWFIIDDDTPNAFALPGGWVGVHRGLFALAKRPEEVAGVLAHEIIHAQKRHGMTRMIGSVGVRLILTMVFGGGDLAILADTGMNLLMLKHSRAHEEEADALGRELMVRAGIDPEGMASMFEALGEAAPQNSSIPAWFSSHPDSQARAAAARRGKSPGRLIELPKLPTSNCSGEKPPSEATE